MAGARMPGNWPEVEQKAAKVDKVNPGKIQEVATQFNDASRNAGDHTAGLKNAASPLQEGGVWNGPAADNFFDYVGKVAAAGDKVRDKLDEAAKELTSLQQTLADLKGQISSTKDDAKRAIDARNQQAEKAAADAIAQQARAVVSDGGQGGPTPEQIFAAADADNTKTAQAAADRIDSLLQQSNQAIQKAQKLMKTEIDGGFSQVPQPGQTHSSMASTGGVSNGGDYSGSSGSSSGGGEAGGGGGAAAGGGGGLGSSGGPPSTTPPGNVQQWIKEAIKILQQNGVPVTEENIDEIWTIIEKESGGDPNAINNWDSNAAKGTPSKGLMQCIDPTFDSFKLPGHDDIYNPVDNIIAGVRYTFDRYGGFEGHPGLESMASGGGYQGY